MQHRANKVSSMWMIPVIYASISSHLHLRISKNCSILHVMEMTIPIVCLSNCSANVCPHVWQRGCFSNWIQNIELVVLAVYIAPFLSQSNKTLHYFQIPASPVNGTLLPWSLWNFPVWLISWVLQPTSLCSTQQRLRSQHKRKHHALCSNRRQYQV